MSTTPLIDDVDFQNLLPWAKAFAKAADHATLDIPHFVRAAHFLVQQGHWQVPPELSAALQSVVGDSPPELALAEGVSDKMSFSSELKNSLFSAATAADWLTKLLGANPATNETAQADPAPTEAAPDAVLLSLLPWLHAALQHHKEAELTTVAMANGVLAALATPALDAHPDFKHLCQGHADELLCWLKQTKLHAKAIEPVFNQTTAVQLAGSMQAVLSDVVHPDEHAPTPVWRWLHAAVADANKYAHVLQVAYHEAGHAVASHVLVPERTVRTISIVPKGDANGYVSQSMNNQFRNSYENSLEYLKEEVVINLAGRAAEDKCYGKDQGDSGAVGDIYEATQMAWQGITVFGLDDVFGPVSIKAAQLMESSASISGYASDMARTGWLHDLAQQRLHTWMTWGMTQARLLVEAHWADIDRLALALFERKTMNNADVRAVLGASRQAFCLTDIPGRPVVESGRL